jgi:hypothetical protein
MMQPITTQGYLYYNNATKYQLFDSFPKRKIPAVKCGDFCFKPFNTFLSQRRKASKENSKE